MKLLLGGLVLLAACGSVDDNTHPPDAPRQDALPDDAHIDIDAPPQARCDASNAFGTPVRVDALDSTADEGDAFLSIDELTVLFTSNRAGGLGAGDIYIATRASVSDTWGTPALLAGVNTAGTEVRPSMSADQLTLFVATRANANSAILVSRATRGSTAVAFGSLAAVAVVNDGGGDNSEPFIAPDQSALYFASTRGTAGDANLLVSTGISGSFSAPAAVAGTMLTTTSNEGAPTLTADQLTLYFRSDRGQSMDIWFATRTSIANGFGTPVNATALNSNSAEVPSWVSADNCVIYFNRNVGTVASNNEIYMAAKPL
ncbi:MAG TPA: hypothetical protein VGM90_03790 [Kofleriaceae bacterium]